MAMSFRMLSVRLTSSFAAHQQRQQMVKPLMENSM